MRNTLKTALLLGLLSAVFLVIGTLLGGQQGLVIALIFAAAFNLGSYWFSDRMVLAMYRAQPAEPGSRLVRTVERLAQRARLPMPKVYVIPSPAANAFATGRNPNHAAVAATQGILQLLNESELEGVIAHELSHVRHRDILISSIAATVAAAIMLLSRFALFFGGGRDRNGNAVVFIATLILAPVAAMLVQAAISRSREFAADHGGSELVGNPDGLVSALRKIEAAAKQRPLEANPATAHLFIVKPFSSKGILQLFSTHPATDERIVRLESGR